MDLPECQVTPMLPAGRCQASSCPFPPGDSPADVLRVSSKGDGPFGGAELSAAGRQLGLTLAAEALTLAGIEVFQDAARK